MMSSKRANRKFMLTWRLDAPPADVFRAWTDPEQLDWFYNDGQPAPTAPIELDLRVGGVWRQYMVVDEHTAYYTGGVYREVVPDERLVFSWGAADGWPELDPDRLDDSPLVTVVLAHDGGCTEMTLRVEFPASFPAKRMPEAWFGHIETGWRDTVDRLAAALETAWSAT